MDEETSQAVANTSLAQDGIAIHKLELELRPSAIAGLLDPQAEMFDAYKDPRMKCVPTSHSWTPAGDILVGCSQGQLLRVILLLVFALTYFM